MKHPVSHKVTRIEEVYSEFTVTYAEQGNFIVQSDQLTRRPITRSILLIFLPRRTYAASVSIAQPMMSRDRYIPYINDTNVSRRVRLVNPTGIKARTSFGVDIFPAIKRNCNINGL